MSYDDLMERIAREIPELAGKLSAPRVTYVKSIQKTYITFESSVLAGESFLEDPTPYRQVLDDFLRRNYPSAAGWIGRIDWKIEKNQLSGSDLPAGEEEALLTLVFPDDTSLQVMSRRNVGARLSKAIEDIFGARVRVEMTVSGDREEQLRKLLAERRETVLVVSREELEKYNGIGPAKAVKLVGTGG